MRKKTHEEFVEQLKEKNPHYPKEINVVGQYENTHTKIQCHCHICNIDFYTTPHSLLEGKGCQKCAVKRLGKIKTKTNEQFLQEIKDINPNIEILGTYQGSHKKLKYKCKICGNVTEQTPTVLLQGHGCRNCANKYISECRTLDKEDVEQRFAKIKDYVRIIGDYKGANKKIECECVICGHHWETVPNVLWHFNCKCPQCSFSHGETKIKDYLLNHNIEYEAQKKFDDLRGINNGQLSYDFYLPNYNMTIEYQGEQHEKPVKHFGEKKFLNQQEHDRRKREYAKNNGYRLLEIWYYDFDNIEEILNRELEVV